MAPKIQMSHPGASLTSRQPKYKRLSLLKKYQNFILVENVKMKHFYSTFYDRGRSRPKWTNMFMKPKMCLVMTQMNQKPISTFNVCIHLNETQWISWKWPFPKRLKWIWNYVTNSPKVANESNKNITIETEWSKWIRMI